ncbi:MAG: hypothetical protein AB1665_01180 [Candidatus Thermoplasmatota archaeon]
MEQDPRAVENPIGAIFDLSEDVVQQAPLISRAVRYATLFMLVWLVINFLLILGFLFDRALFFFILAAALFVIGLAALLMLRRTSSFFRYYVVRHAAIKAVRDADPLIYAPSGSTPAERLAFHLRSVSAHLNEPQVEFAIPGVVEGQTRVRYKFDLYAHREPSALWRLLGLGDPGLSVFVKVFDRKPSAEDITAFRAAVEDVTSRTRIQPMRVIALWTNPSGEVLDDAAYAALMKNQVKFTGRLLRSSCAIELISERAGGEYDFIPFIAPQR